MTSVDVGSAWTGYFRTEVVYVSLNLKTECCSVAGAIRSRDFNLALYEFCDERHVRLIAGGISACFRHGHCDSL